jgi:hypothetical protein
MRAMSFVIAVAASTSARAHRVDARAMLHHQRSRRLSVIVAAASRDADASSSDRRRASWDDRYAELALFRAMHATIELPRALDAQRRWLARQRSLARRGELSTERRERLVELGVTFDLRKSPGTRSETKSFETRVRELAKEVAAGRDARNASAPLRKWVSHQIADYRDGNISNERYETLRDLGVDFDDVQERTVRRWEERFEELKAFAKREGHCRVPENEDDGLYFWVLDQRRARRDGRLSNARVEAMDALGMEWEVRAHRVVSWEERLEETRAFYEARGRLPRSVEDEALFQWIRGQRRRFERGELEPERVDALDAVCDAWKVKRASEFERRATELEAYAKTFQTTRVDEERDERLAAWTRRMRTKRRNGTLSQKKVDALNAIGMDWTDGDVADAR